MNGVDFLLGQLSAYFPVGFSAKNLNMSVEKTFVNAFESPLKGLINHSVMQSYASLERFGNFVQAFWNMFGACLEVVGNLFGFVSELAWIFWELLGTCLQLIGKWWETVVELVWDSFGWC